MTEFARPMPPQPRRPDRVWMVHQDGQQYGPYLLEELTDMVSGGSLTDAALVWRDGLPQWIPISNVVTITPAPAPLEYQYSSSSLARKAYHGQPTNRVAAGVLGILLGGLGIHKFILGYTGAGLTMLLVSLLTFGFGYFVMAIIGLVEGIIYLTKSEADFYREYVARKKPWF